MTNTMKADMRSLSEIREDELKAARKGITADAHNVHPVQYCIDGESGLVMRVSDFLAAR